MLIEQKTGSGLYYTTTSLDAGNFREREYEHSYGLNVGFNGNLIHPFRKDTPGQKLGI